MKDLLHQMYVLNYNYIVDYCDKNGYRLITKIEDSANYPDTMYIQKDKKDIYKVCISSRLSKQDFITAITKIGE